MRRARYSACPPRSSASDEAAAGGSVTRTRIARNPGQGAGGAACTRPVWYAMTTSWAAPCAQLRHRAVDVGPYGQRAEREGLADLGGLDLPPAARPITSRSRTVSSDSRSGAPVGCRENPIIPRQPIQPVRVLVAVAGDGPIGGITAEVVPGIVVDD